MGNRISTEDLYKITQSLADRAVSDVKKRREDERKREEAIKKNREERLAAAAKQNRIPNYKGGSLWDQYKAALASGEAKNASDFITKRDARNAAWNKVGAETLNDDMEALAKSISSTYGTQFDPSKYYSQETINGSSDQVKKMRDRLNALAEYYNTYGGSDDQKKAVGEQIKAYDSELKFLNDLGAHYGQYKNEADFNYRTDKRRDEDYIVNDYDAEAGKKNLAELKGYLDRINTSNDSLSTGQLISNARSGKKAYNRTAINEAKQQYGLDGMTDDEVLNWLTQEYQLESFALNNVDRMRTAAGYRNLANNEDFLQGVISGKAVENPTFEDYLNYENAATQKRAEAYNKRKASDPILTAEDTKGQDAPSIVNKLRFYEDLTNDKYGNKTDSTTVWSSDLGAAKRDALGYHYGLMTDDEKRVYYYLLGTQGKEAADKYLEDMDVTLDYRNTEEVKQFVRDLKNSKIFGNVSAAALANTFGGLGGAALGYLIADNNEGVNKTAGDIAYSAASVPLNVLGGGISTIGEIGQRLDLASKGDWEGKGYNPYENYNLFSVAGREARGLVAKDIEDKIGWEMFGQNVMSQVYQSLMSGVDSAFGMATLGRLYTISMGGSAAASKAAELYESGASSSQIYWESLLSGIAEATFEYLSIENLSSIRNIVESKPTTLKKAIKMILTQNGIEASEEVFTEIANTVIDKISKGYDSDYDRKVTEYVRDGMTREEAVKKAAGDVAADIGWAGAGGFISGLASSSLTIAGAYRAGKANADAQISAIDPGNAEGLYNNAKKIDYSILNDASEALKKGDAKAAAEIISEGKDWYEYLKSYAKEKYGKNQASEISANIDASIDNLNQIKNLISSGDINADSIQAVLEKAKSAQDTKVDMTSVNDEKLFSLLAKGEPSNSVIEKNILKDRGTLAAFERLTGLRIGGTTVSQKRADVREAFKAVSSSTETLKAAQNAIESGATATEGHKNAAVIIDQAIQANRAENSRLRNSEKVKSAETKAAIDATNRQHRFLETVRNYVINGGDLSGFTESPVSNVSGEGGANSSETKTTQETVKKRVRADFSAYQDEITATEYNKAVKGSAAEQYTYFSNEEKKLNNDIKNIAESEAMTAEEKAEAIEKKNEEKNRLYALAKSTENVREMMRVKYAGNVDRLVEELQPKLKKYGIKIDVVDNIDAAGKSSSGAYFDRNTNTIKVSRNWDNFNNVVKLVLTGDGLAVTDRASVSFDRAVTQTIAHEIAHADSELTLDFIKAVAGTQYDAFDLKGRLEHPDDRSWRSEDAQKEKNWRRYVDAYTEQAMLEMKGTEEQRRASAEKVVNDAYIFEEIMADMFGAAVDDMGHSSKAGENIFWAMNRNKPGIIKRILNALERFVARIRGKDAYLAVEQRQAAERLRDMLTGELKRAYGTDVKGEAAVESDDGKRYSITSDGKVSETASDDTSSIKEQLRNSLDTVNALESVASVEYSPTNKKELKDRAISEFRKIGFVVDRQNFGKIDIGEKQITNSLNYLNTEAEKAALLTVPKVLKRGEIISGHKDHKGRAYSTITIAAPVEINGVRGNVAATVRQTGASRYYTHRILLPNGSEFIFAESRKNEEPTFVGMPAANDSQRSTISSSSVNSISQADGNVNRKFSENSDVQTIEDGGTVENDSGEFVAESDGNGGTRWSLSTYESSGRETLRQYLDGQVSESGLTEADAKAVLDSMDDIYEICRKYEGEYVPFGAWSRAEVVIDEKGNPVFSVVKPNGEYAMNLDFSLVCKKRRALDAVLNRLIETGAINDFGFGQEEIVRVNEIIREHGFEIACDMCFVDAKRYRQAGVADQFVDLYNSIVKSMAKDGQEIDYFNFANDSSLSHTEGGIDRLSDAELDFSEINEITKPGAKKTMAYRVAQYLKTHPADRKLLSRGDFMSTAGFDAVKASKPDILKIYNVKKGAGGPKAAQSDVQYLNDILSSKKFNRSAAYDVGGVRVQSFSDYVPRLVFDYVQMIGDLAAKRLPAHAYTKEPLFAKQFGLTGMKINMSLMPAKGNGKYAGLNADGSYAWARESFPAEEAFRIQADPEYGKNVGTIAVGISDEHIWKMLSDPDIRMVIPYHKSGINPAVAVKLNIGEYTNYTDQQNTRRRDGRQLTKSELKNIPDINRLMHRDGLDAVEASRRYVEWCEDNGYIPKFEKFAYMTDSDGSRMFNENYYKLLEDFTTMVDGEFHPQGDVTATFPGSDSAFGSMADLIKEGLEEDAVTANRLNGEVDGLAEEVRSALGREESGKRFSLSSNVEQTKDLIAVHNMTAAELEKSLDLGGLPMPSIAIIKAADGHSEYGDVSLVFGKDTIDPKKSARNKVYGGDAWTPTFPKIDYKANEKVGKRIRDKYYDLSRKYGYDNTRALYDYAQDLSDVLTSKGGEKAMIDKLYGDTGMMQIYLMDTGRERVANVNKETKTALTDGQVRQYENLIDTLGRDEMNGFAKKDREELSDLVRRRKAFIEENEAGIRKAFEKTFIEDGMSAKDAAEVSAELALSDLRKYVLDTFNYIKNGAETVKTEFDSEATNAAIKKAADGEGYRKWINNLFGGAEEKSGIRNSKDAYTASGNRRSFEALHWENNLENIVKAMLEQDETGGAFFSGMGIWGVSAKKYNSISDIKNDSSRLRTMNEAEYNALKEQYGARMQEIAQTLIDPKNDNYFIASDDAYSLIVDAVRNSKDESGILRYLKKYNSRATEKTASDIAALVRDIAEMPTGYFEAKPQRAVGFDEVKAVILPDNASGELVSRLESDGINTVTYKAGDENSRLEALNGVRDVRFSLARANGITTEITDDSYDEYEGGYQRRDIKLNGETVGTVAIRIYDDYSEIDRIDIDEKYRNKGIGTTVLGDIAGESDTTYIVPDNESAKRLYERIGEEVTSGEVYENLDQGYGVYRLDKSYGNTRWSLVGTNKDGIEVYETSDDIKNLTNKERMKRFEEIMKNDYRGRTAKFIRNGHAYYATFEDTDVKKNIYGDNQSSKAGWKAKIRAGADGDIFELVEDADYTGSGAEQGKSNPAHKGINLWDYYAKTVQIDNEVYDLVANVRRSGDDSYVYNIGLRQNKKIKASPPIGIQKNSVNTGAQRSDNSVSQNDPVVNTQSMQDVEKDSSDERHSLVKSAQSETETIEAEDKAIKNVLEKFSKERYYKSGYPYKFNEFLNRIADLSETSGERIPREQLLDTVKRLFRYAYENRLDGKALGRDYRHDTDILAAMVGDIENEIYDWVSPLRDEYNEARDAKKKLRMEKIFIPTEIRASVAKAAGFETWSDFRKSLFGIVGLVNEQKGRALSEVYAELSEIYPEYFPDNITDGTEQAVLIADLARNMRVNGIGESNVLSYEEQLVKKSIGRAISEFLYNGENTVSINAMRKRIAQLKEQREKAITSLKEKYAEQFKNRSEKQKQTVLRNKVLRKYTEASSMLDRPTTENHFTEAMRKPLMEFLAAVDITTGKSVAKQGIYDRILRVIEAANNATAEDGKNGLDIAETDLNVQEKQLIVDSGLLERMSAWIEANQGKKLTELSSAQLEELNGIFNQLKHLTAEIKRLYDPREGLAAKSWQAQKEIGLAQTKDREQVLGAKTERARGMYEQVHFGALDPSGYYNTLGSDTMTAQFERFRRCQNRFSENIQMFTDRLGEIVDGAIPKDEHGKNAKEVTLKLSHGTLTATPAQLMSIHLMLNQEDSRRCLFNEAGGVIIGKFTAEKTKDGKAHIAGKRTFAQSGRLVLNEADAAKITAALTDGQRKRADAISALLNNEAARLGNEVSMAMYGYKKYTTENYFPMRTADDYRAIADNPNYEMNLLGLSFTKERTGRAGKALVAEDIYDVIGRHLTNMAQYNAFAQELDNAKKMYSLRLGDGTSLKQRIIRSYGREADAFYNKLINNLSGVQMYTNNSAEALSDKLLSNYKAAAVAGNVSVVLKQPMSIFRALPEFSLAGLKKSMAFEDILNLSPKQLKANTAEMLKYSGIARLKAWGSSENMTRKSFESLYNDNSDTARQKINEFLTSGAENADMWTWAKLWRMSKAEIDAQGKYTAASKEYFEAVDRKFSDVIGKTQVVQSALDSSMAVQNAKGFGKFLFAFQNEPLKQYSYLISTLNDARRGKPGAKKKLAKVIASSLANAAAVSAISTFMAWLRGTLDRDDDDELLDDLMKEFAGNSIDDLLSGAFAPVWQYIDTIMGAINSGVYGNTVERLDMAALTDLGGLINKYFISQNGGRPNLGTVQDIVNVASNLFGLPAKNIFRDVKSVIDRIILELPVPSAAKYNYLKAWKDVELTNKAAVTEAYYDVLRDAVDRGRYSDYVKIKRDMIYHGYTETKIKNAVMKSSLMDDLYELKKVNPGSYKAKVNSIVSSVSAVSSLEGKEFEDFIESAMKRREREDGGSKTDDEVYDEMHRKMEKEVKEQLIYIDVSKRAAYIKKMLKTYGEYGITEADILKVLRKAGKA